MVDVDGCEYDSRPPRCQVATLGKLITSLVCLCSAVCNGLVVAWMSAV